MKCSVNLLIPYNDNKLASPRPGINIIEGNEADVMSRYASLQEKHPAHYVVRITADCPLLKPALISKAITIAAKGQYDYLTNAMPGFRTFHDGADVEVISAQMIKWLDHTNTGKDREHVTSSIKEKAPPWANIGHLFSDVDNSQLKLSVDTSEDLKNVEKHYFSVQEKIRRWSNRYGPNTCHRF
jgi:spore coat polysaccharide biosynthesis protein SpsF